MFKPILAILLFLQAANATSMINRKAIQRELRLYELSQVEGIIDPYFDEAIAKRRNKRQVTGVDFPSDDEDTLTADGSGDAIEKEILQGSNENTPFPNDPAASATDWTWYRATIDFHDSIIFSADLQDYRTPAFASLAFDVMKPMRERLNVLLDGFFEMIPIAFRKRGENVDVIFDIGTCARITPSVINKALKSLVGGGTISRYRVSSGPPLIRKLETVRNKRECIPGPSRPTTSSTSIVPPQTTTRNTPGTEPSPSRSPVIPDRYVIEDSRVPSCRYDQATCRNLECIDRSYVCDGSPDCSDGSDEGEACTATSRRCEPNQFLCEGTGICAQKIWLCDGDNDCGNGFDEANCGPPEQGSLCASNQFQCGDGSCIPMSHLCDRDSDCDDGSDENNCSPPVAIQPPRRRIEAVEGETITLRCETSGNPVPVVSWRVNWGSVPPPPRVTMTSEDGIGFLTIRKIKKSDQGAYTCEAMNIINSILVTPDAIVIVHEKNMSKPTTNDRPNQCPPGTFNASPFPPYLCQPCFCFGITDQCYPSKLEFSKIGINFTKPEKDNGGVKLEPENTIDGDPGFQQPVTNNQIRINSPAKELQLIDLSKRFLAAAHYWSLPARFLGAKINSYGGTLTFTFSYNASYDISPSPTREPDVIIEGNGKRLLYSYPGPHPEPEIKHIRTVIFSELDNWKTPEGKNATRSDFMKILLNMDRILLRTVYDSSMHSTGLGEVTLQVAEPLLESNPPEGEDQLMMNRAYSVEECICPPEYTGLSCESCAPGYERVNDGPFAGTCIISEEHKGTPPDTICEEGYTGSDCESCEVGYTPYNGGCTRFPDTYCEVAGSIGLDVEGNCVCKDGCEGARCDRCKAGYYFLSTRNVDGCLPCFCMNVTDRCVSSNWNRIQIVPSFGISESFLLKNIDTGFVFEDGITVERISADNVVVSAPLERYPSGIYFWILPQKFTGNQLQSYGGNFSFTINYDESEFAVALLGNSDVRIVSKGQVLNFRGSLPNPSEDVRISVELREENWISESGSSVSREDFLLALSDISNLLVRATYSNDMRTSRIKDISLDSALPQNTGGSRAVAVEQCFCPVGYTGLSCEDCADGFHRVRRGKNAGTCQPCNCHRHAEKCDKETGICINCLHNTVGHHCSRCADGYYGNAKIGTPLDCKVCPCPILDNGIAVCSVDCEGRPVCMRCPEGYEGKACDQCSDGYVRDPRNPAFCTTLDRIVNCSCNPTGSINANCNVDRRCNCKESTTGPKCDQCKAGYFYLDVEYSRGCLPCFCMGVTDQCTSSQRPRYEITANFSNNFGGFRLTQQSCNTHVTEDYVVSNNGRTITYSNFDQLPQNKPYFWQLPEDYRGNKIGSYGGAMEYHTKFLASKGGERITTSDVILVGNGIMLVTRDEPRREVLLRPNTTIYNRIVFREEFWVDINGEPATREKMLMALADVDSILIRATYWTTQLSTSLSDFSMDTLSETTLTNEPALEVEQCTCPRGYVGTSCEECAAGYTRVEQGLYLGICELCQCNGHSSQCDSGSGRCLNCQHNTAGDRCEQCAVGYYGDATGRTPSDCQPCACPGMGRNSFSETCQLGADNSLLCTACREGYTGRRCERCAPGYEGNPSAVKGRCTRMQGPRIRVQPRNVVIQEGKSAVFVCQATNGSPDVYFAWTKENGIIPVSRATDYAGILRIINARRSDTGTYVCLGSNRGGLSRSYARLTVLPAENGECPSALVTPREQQVTEGGNAIFYCKVKGNPKPKVTWTKSNGDPLPSNSYVHGHMLMISSVRAADQSSYKCRAINSHGIVESTGALDVTVTGSVPEVTILTETAMVIEGGQTTLRCTASGVPTPTLTWSKEGGSRLPSNVRASDGNLVITSATLNNQGIYECVARNGFGEDRGIARLYVKRHRMGRPICRTDPKEVTAYMGTNSTINCVVGGNPRPRVHWETADGSPLDSNIQLRGTEMLIHAVRRDNAGNYICVATNAFGTTRSRMTLHVVRKELPSIIINPLRRQRVRAGQDVTVDCLAPGQNDVIITWERANSQPFSGNTFLSNNNSRLNIRGVTRNERGNYRCIATNVVGQRSTYAYITVIELPVITLLPSRSMTVIEGQTVRMTCQATGYPAPSVVWHGGNPPRRLTNYRRRTSVYSIEPVTSSDAGVYYCRATNEAGTSQERLILNVNQQVQQTRPVITLEAPTVQGVIGNPVQLHCNASGNPTPGLRWFKVDGQLPYGVRQVDGILYIGSLKREDAGTYECIARNSVGIDRRRLTLTLIETPVVRVSPRNVIERVGQSASFLCEIASNSDLLDVTPHWSKVEGRLDGYRVTTSGGRLTINELRLGDAGEYRCSASNQAGSSSENVLLTVHMTPSVELIVTDGKTTFVEGEELSIGCRATGFPVPNVILEKNKAPVPLNDEGVYLIESAVPIDSGRYKCIASSDAGIDHHSRQITVTAQKTQRMERKRIEITSGERLALQCELNDELSPQSVVWSKQNSILPEYAVEEGTQLVIEQVGVDDVGTYLCLVQYESETIKTFNDVFVNAYIAFLSQTPLSYMGVPLKRGQLYTSFDIEISFKPNVLDGLLLFSNGPNRDFMSLSLNNGIVEFRFDLGSGIADIKSQASVELNKWHSVALSRRSFSGRLRLDNGPVVSGRSPGKFRGFDGSSKLYVGGVPNSFLLPPSLRYLGRDVGFYGCISQLDIGSGFIDFGINRNVSEKVGISQCKMCGSRRRDSPCQNDARCVETYSKKSGYFCYCQQGYAGENCQNSIAESAGRNTRRRSSGRAIVRATRHNDVQHTARFSGSSFALFRAKVFPHHRAAEQLSMRFKTTEENGLILLHGQKLLPKAKGSRLICEKQGKHFGKCDYVKLEVKNSRLVYSFSVGGVNVTGISRNFVSDGVWHSVTVIRQGDRAKLWVDGFEQEFVGLPKGEMGRPRVSGTVYIGGLPLRLASANNVPFFEGCIADVKLSAIKRAQLESFVSSRVDDDTKRLDFGRSKHKNLGSCSGGDD